MGRLHRPSLGKEAVGEAVLPGHKMESDQPWSPGQGCLMLKDSIRTQKPQKMFFYQKCTISIQYDLSAKRISQQRIFKTSVITSFEGHRPWNTTGNLFCKLDYQTYYFTSIYRDGLLLVKSLYSKTISRSWPLLFLFAFSGAHTFTRGCHFSDGFPDWRGAMTVIVKESSGHLCKTGYACADLTDFLFYQKILH